MRKSFIYMFMTVMAVVSVGVVSSCKDYDEDHYVVLTKENASLRALLENYKAELDRKITELEEAQRNCMNTCSLAREVLAGRISALETAMDTKADKSTVTALQNQVTTLQNTVSGLQTTVGQIQSAITTIQGDISTINSTLTTVQGDITTIKSTLTTIQGDISTINGKLTTIEGNITTIQGDITTIQGDITTIKGDITTIQGDVTTIKGDITTIKGDITTIQGDITTINSKLTQVINDAAEALERAKNDSIWVKELEQVVGETNGRIDSLNGWLETYRDSVYTAFKNYDEAIRILNERNEIITDSLVTLDDNIKRVQNNLDAAERRLDARINSLADQVEANKEAIEALDTKVQNILGRLDKLENANKKLITGIVINETVNPVFGTFNLPADVRSTLLFGYYGEAKQGGEFPSVASDGLYVNDTYALTQADYDILNISDLYTYTSGDILVNDGNDGDSLNVGTLYMTVNPTNVDFSGTDFTLVNSLDEEAKATLDPLKKSDHKIQFGYTRAGVDEESANGFYETQVKIAKADVQSAAVHAEGLLNAAKDVLNYAKGASVSIDASGNIHYTNGESLNLSALALTVYNNISEVADANAVKATWTDDVVGERSVYSQYNLGATAIKSLGGYASFKDFHYATVPGYESAINIINHVASSLKARIQDAWPNISGGVTFTMPTPTIHSISFDRSQFDPNDFNITKAINIEISFDIESGYYFVPSDDKMYLHIYDESDTYVGRLPFGTVNSVRYDGSQYIYNITVYRHDENITVDLRTEMDKLFDAIDQALQDAFDSVGTMYNDIDDAIQTLLSSVNSMLAEINNVDNKLGDSIDSMASVLQGWISRANSRIVNFINSANYRLQPFIVSTSSEGTKKLSGAKNYPTAIPATSTFVLTNYTGEIIAPALKKHVACTNVFKDSDSAQDGNSACLSALQAVNQGDFNKVLDGSTVFVEATGFQTGYTYEIAISALDYEGMQTTRKFYVTVK